MNIIRGLIAMGMGFLVVLYCIPQFIMIRSEKENVSNAGIKEKLPAEEGKM